MGVGPDSRCQSSLVDVEVGVKRSKRALMGWLAAFGLEERRGNFGQSFWHVDHGAVRDEHEHLDLALEFLGGACWGAPKEKRYREHDKS